MRKPHSVYLSKVIFFITRRTTVSSNQTESDGLELAYVAVVSAVEIQNFAEDSTFANYLGSEQWVEDLNDAGVSVTSADTSELEIEQGVRLNKHGLVLSFFKSVIFFILVSGLLL